MGAWWPLSADQLVLHTASDRVDRALERPERRILQGRIPALPMLSVAVGWEIAAVRGRSGGLVAPG
jgi:hypothetical protein